jgi:hypothetical protein
MILLEKKYSMMESTTVTPKSGIITLVAKFLRLSLRQVHTVPEFSERHNARQKNRKR